MAKPTSQPPSGTALLSLERRPEATTFKVEDLLAEVKVGRVRIPPFQRQFQWEREDARQLVDSIYRGYPIGTLLFWQTRAEAGVVTFGTVSLPGRARDDAYWVVDGQQRIVSLVRVLLAAAERNDQFALFFDLDTQEIVSARQTAGAARRQAQYLPLTEVLDSTRLLRWAIEHIKDDEQALGRALQFGKRVREYEVPATIVHTEQEEVLREIFGRINDRGRPLKSHEVFDALNGVRSAARPASIQEIANGLRSLRFGAVEEKILYRLLRVLQGEDVAQRRPRLAPQRLADEDAARLYSRTAVAASRVIEFLTVDAGIRRYELVPYKQPFVALGKFFDLHPSASARSRELLARWIWRGALTGAHRGDTVWTRQVIGAIVADEDESVQRMLAATLVEGCPQPDGSESFNFRNAATKLEVLAMMELKPRHLVTGAPLDEAELLEPGAGEVPQLLGPAGLPDRGPFSRVANRLAHPPVHGLRKLLEATEDPAILQSHAIDAAAMASLRSGELSDFLTRRQTLLSRHFEAFFESRARWVDNDRRPIAALIEESAN